MTMHTRYKMVCACGHAGALKMIENDQPYSRMYEIYSLEGFEGTPYSVDGYADLETAISAMQPVCPKCGASLTAANVSA